MASGRRGGSDAVYRRFRRVLQVEGIYHCPVVLDGQEVERLPGNVDLGEVVA